MTRGSRDPRDRLEVALTQGLPPRAILADLGDPVRADETLVEVDPQEVLTLKGFRRPVIAYRVRGLKAPHS